MPNDSNLRCGRSRRNPTLRWGSVLAVSALLLLVAVAALSTMGEPRVPLSRAVASVSPLGVAPRLPSPAAVTTNPDLTLTNGTTVNYSVTFSETGLANGSNWWVDLGGQNLSASVPSITFWVANGTYSFVVGSTTGLFAQPPLGNVTVSGFGQSYGIYFGSNPTYPVQFSENGSVLPVGTWWGVDTTSGTSVDTNGTSVTLYLTNGTYNYTVLAPGSTNISAVPDTGYVTVSGAPVNITVTYVFGPPEYPIQFVESGLPARTNWGVYLGGNHQNTTNSSLVIYEPNGTYSYRVGASNGYVTGIPVGNVTVTGGSATVIVTFVPPPPYYAVNFTESGLAAGTNWSVTLAGSSQGAYQTSNYFLEPNGTYVYSVTPQPGYIANPANGTVIVNGVGLVVFINFSGQNFTTFAVTLSESGLASATTWGGTITGRSGTSSFLGTGSSVTFQEPNGTYALSITPVAGYTASYSSALAVNGSAVTQGVTFTPNSTAPSSFAVTVVESGHPNGTTWGASLGGVAQSSSTASIGFTEPNGTYALNVTPPANYTANYSSPVVVNGGSVSVGVVFSNSTYPVSFAEQGLPSSSAWTMTAVNVGSHLITSGRSTGTSLILWLAEGSYRLTATGPAGYSVTLSVSDLSVNGAGPLSVAATFTTSAPSAVNAASLPWFTTAILVVTGVIGALGAAWGYTQYRVTRLRSVTQNWIAEWKVDAGEGDEPPAPPGSP
ncbi:MAG: hypothetical protein L3K02_01885 [Thermoplasmata archaeon]|nr:hypothetical protein [Thermoplasmata archaeon]